MRAWGRGDEEKREPKGVGDFETWGQDRGETLEESPIN